MIETGWGATCRRVGLAGLSLSALMVAGCASSTQPAPPAPPPAPDPASLTQEPDDARPDFEAWYDELDEHRRDYEDGLALIAAGEEILGETQIGAAADAIVARAEECSRTEGCEFDRFLDAFSHLLMRQSIELKRQTARITELEAGLEADLEHEPGTTPLVAPLPENATTVSALRGTDLREIIQLNGPVQAALDDWLTWMRPNLMQAYENYQMLRDRIAPVYEEAGLPEALLFGMIATESGGKVHAYSRAGAAGILQFMRYTGRRYGLGTENGFDQRLDPAMATRANVAYLNDLFAEFDNNLEKALASYNAGEGRIRRAHSRYGRDVSFWDRRVYWSMPRETREYVPRIFAAAWLFMHPEQYNLEWPAYEVENTTLTVRQDVSLGELTICLGQEQNRDGWFRTLRNLNPQFKPGERIEAGTEIVLPSFLVPIYRESCAAGELIAKARLLHDANYPDGSEMVPYVVQRGDTLGRIASRHTCVSLRELAAINNVRPPRYMIRIGQTLKVPNCS